MFGRVAEFSFPQRCSWFHPGVVVSGNIRTCTLTSGETFSRRHIVLTCRVLLVDGVWGHISSDSCLSLLFCFFISSFHSVNSSLVGNLKPDWTSQWTFRFKGNKFIRRWCQFTAAATLWHQDLPQNDKLEQRTIYLTCLESRRSFIWRQAPYSLIQSISNISDSCKILFSYLVVWE